MDDPLSRSIHIACGVTSVVMAAEEAWEENGQEVKWQYTGTRAGHGMG